MDAIHSATGSLSQGLIIFLAVAGLAIFQFKYTRQYLQRVKIDRKKLVSLHKLAAVILIPALIVHYYTTDKNNVYVIISAVMALMLVPYGLLFRVKSLKSAHFKKLVVAKIVILSIAMSFAFAGHTIIEQHKDSQTKVAQLR